MALRTNIRRTIAAAAVSALKVLGAEVTLTNRANTAVTVWAAPGEEQKEYSDEMETMAEVTTREYFVPQQAGLQAEITTKALTTNVATITTLAAHGFVVGMYVRIVLDTADSVFDGYQTIDTVPTTTTFTFAKTNANVTSVAAIGDTYALINNGDKIIFEGIEYRVESIANDALRCGYTLKTMRTRPTTVGLQAVA